MKYGKTKTFAKIADGKPSKNSAGVDFLLVSLYIYDFLLVSLYI